ncbi:hypothetical protein AB0883_10735 [Micromonospora sp. NPDC047812]
MVDGERQVERDENVDDLGGFIVQPRDESEDGVFRLSGDRAWLAG